MCAGRGKEKCLKIFEDMFVQKGWSDYTLLKTTVVRCKEKFIEQNVCKFKC